MDQLIVGLAARFAPHRPGDRVEQRRLAVAVLAAEAGHADARQVERRTAFAVAEDVVTVESSPLSHCSGHRRRNRAASAISSIFAGGYVVTRTAGRRQGRQSI